MTNHREIIALALAAYIIFSVAGIAMLLARGSNEIMGKATSSSGTVSINITGVTATTTVQCNDGIDNDGDKLIDYGGKSTNDPGCSSATDNTESNAATPAGRVLKGHEEDGITIDKNSLDISFQAGALVTTTIVLINYGDEEKTYTATLYGLDGVIRVRETSFVIPGNSRYEVVLESIGDTPGVYTGKLVIQGSREIRTYTITAVVLDGPASDRIFETYYPVEYRIVCPGCFIGFTLTLDNLGEPALATYSIMDYQNNVVYREHDIIQPNEVKYSKTIKLPDSIPEGEYVLFVAVNAEGRTGVTSHRFEVKELELREERASATTKLGIMLLLIGLIIFNALLIKTKPEKKR